jgi:hypothetical protein
MLAAWANCRSRKICRPAVATTSAQTAINRYLNGFRTVQTFVSDSDEAFTVPGLSKKSGKTGTSGSDLAILATSTGAAALTEGLEAEGLTSLNLGLKCGVWRPAMPKDGVLNCRFSSNIFVLAESSGNSALPQPDKCTNAPINLGPFILFYSLFI